MHHEDHNDWTPDEDELLRAGIRHHRTYGQIAADLGRTRGSVQGRALSLGLNNACSRAATPNAKHPEPPTKVRNPVPLFTAEITRDGAYCRYRILGPAGPICSGRYRGTKAETAAYLAKTLKRANEGYASCAWTTTPDWQRRWSLNGPQPVTG